MTSGAYLKRWGKGRELPGKREERVTRAGLARTKSQGDLHDGQKKRGLVPPLLVQHLGRTGIGRVKKKERGGEGRT